MARRFRAEGAVVVVTDIDAAAAAGVAAPIGATAVGLDVTDAEAVAGLVARVVAEHGRIDLFCSNAGVALGGGLDAGPEVWRRAWDVNVMAHVHAAQAVVPVMRSQGHGYLLQTCSAAGLLSAPGDPSYTATKHAAVAFAEWLALTYAARRDPGQRAVPARRGHPVADETAGRGRHRGGGGGRVRGDHQRRRRWPRPWCGGCTRNGS